VATVADDFEALRTIGTPLADLDPERAARMRARALASTLGDEAADAPTRSGAVLTESPTDRRPTGPRSPHADRPRRRDRADHIVRLVPDGPPTEIHLDRPGESQVIGDAGRRADGAAHGRRPFVVVTAAAAVVAIVIGLAVARSGQRSEVVADQPQPTSVTEIAANASTLVDRPLAAGEYAYLAVSDGQPFEVGDAEETHVKVEETWISTTGEGRERTSATEIVDGSGRTVGTFDGAVDTGHTQGVPGFSVFGYDGLRSLPTDPADLRAVLDSGASWPVSAYSRSYIIADLLMLDATPPGVRAAALTILAEDGATVVADAEDRDGHQGIGIVLPRSDGFTSVYVVNRDGLLLGSYDVITGDALDPDRAVVWSTVRDQRRVASTD
jgi:hypothetical protein